MEIKTRMSVTDDLPEDFLLLLTVRQRELINNHYEKIIALTRGEVAPLNSLQERFARVDAGLEKPLSDFEFAWIRFKFLRSLHERVRGDSKKISELEFDKRELIENIKKLDIKFRLLYQRTLDDRLNFKRQSNESEEASAGASKELYAIKNTVSELNTEVRALEGEVRVLRNLLDNAYTKIRKYEVELGVEFTLPEKFSNKDSQPPSRILFESMPPTAPSDLFDKCQSCFRPINFCICGK